jgi:hypothetical protein
LIYNGLGTFYRYFIGSLDAWYGPINGLTDRYVLPGVTQRKVWSRFYRFIIKIRHLFPKRSLSPALVNLRASAAVASSMVQVCRVCLLEGMDFLKESLLNQKIDMKGGQSFAMTQPGVECEKTAPPLEYFINS